MEPCFALVCNIPPTFHSSDLRNYFSEFVETGNFACFHFRHRPQSELLSLTPPSRANLSDTQQRQTPKMFALNPLVSIVKFTGLDVAGNFKRKYQFQNWVDAKDDTLITRCIIVPVKIDATGNASILPVVSFDSKPFNVALSEAKLNSLVELKPPAVMPQGNVGTPTKHFLILIRSCQLPSNLIGKLGLHFPKSKTRKYGNVPFDYGSTLQYSDESVTSLPSFRKKSGKLLTNCTLTNCEEQTNNMGPTDEEEEEWDRHAALHDDITEQDRTKERLYEEEEEVVWEKGGPGLVWYTDACLWKEGEGDFDEQTSDDWDVDYGVYFRDGDGDKDARDALEMRQSTLWRHGQVESAFKKPGDPAAASSSRKNHKSHSSRDAVGRFEVHTRGIGRRLMERQGWKEGLGLGRSQKGIITPVESDGQKPTERKGLGYYGEKLPRFGISASQSGRVHKPRIASEERVIISTVFDQPGRSDPAESLLQRNPSTSMKFREISTHIS